MPSPASSPGTLPGVSKGVKSIETLRVFPSQQRIVLDKEKPEGSGAQPISNALDGRWRGQIQLGATPCAPVPPRAPHQGGGQDMVPPTGGLGGSGGTPRPVCPYWLGAGMLLLKISRDMSHRPSTSFQMMMYLPRSIIWSPSPNKV